MNRVNLTVRGVELSIAFDENSLHIYNAFLVKDELKSLGYRWNPADKSWYIRSADARGQLETLRLTLAGGYRREALPGSEGEGKGGLTSSLWSSRKVNTGFDDSARFDGETSVFRGEEAADIVKIDSGLPDSLTVSELRRRIDQLLRDGIRGTLWVRGVIASEVKHYQWASYFDLRDEDSGRDVFFRVEIKKSQRELVEQKLSRSGAAAQLERELPVFLCVEVFLPLRNVMDIRLSVADILPEFTQARLRSQKDITLEKLHEEGILQNQKQLTPPAVSVRIGLITSAQGTSVADIIAALSPCEVKYDFYFVDSRMEGVHAVDSIIRALDFLEHSPRGLTPPDIIIIARGGGSEQSLAVFNDLRLCRRVCLAGVPIIAAIGHEKDVSAIEQCAWLTPSPATPSGIGKYLKERYLELENSLANAVAFLLERFSAVQRQAVRELDHQLKSIFINASAQLRMRTDGFFHTARRLEQSIFFTMREHERRLAVLAGQVRSGGVRIQNQRRARVSELAYKMVQRALLIREQRRALLERAVGRIGVDRMIPRVHRKNDETAKIAAHCATLLKRKLDAAARDLENRANLIAAHDPQNILKKGFTLTLDEDGHIIKSINELTGKKRALLKFHDGSTPVAPIVSADNTHFPLKEQI